MLKGHCLCGAIHYQTTGTPSQETFCHCSLCRRASGASPVAWFTVPVSSFKFTEGRAAQYQSSPHGVRRFCSQCGTQLTFQSSKTRNEIDITIASLDDADLVRPRSHTHIASKLECVALTDGLPAYKQGAPGN